MLIEYNISKSNVINSVDSNVNDDSEGYNADGSSDNQFEHVSIMVDHTVILLDANNVRI